MFDDSEPVQKILSNRVTRLFRLIAVFVVVYLWMLHLLFAQRPVCRFVIPLRNLLFVIILLVS